MTDEATIAKLKTFLEEETQYPIGDPSENLIQRAILDSFSMIKLVQFIETEFKVTVPMEELTPENFNSLDRMAKMINVWK